MASVSVRSRLTLWHVLVMGLLLAIFSLSIYVFVRESLFSQLDSRLQENVNLISQTVRTNLDELIEIERHTWVIAFRVTEGDWPLYLSGAWVAYNLDAAGKPSNTGRWIHSTRQHGIFHLQQAKVKLGAREFIITTAEQGEQIHRSLYRLGVALLMGYPLILLLSLVGGYFLAGRALNPLQDITARARSINAENLSARLTIANSHDELGQLSSVLNDAFSRLEESFNRLRRFSQDVAHELRTPLAVIRSVGEVGLQEQRTANAYRDVIGSMLEELDRLERLVGDLLTLAHAESGRFSADLNSEDIAALCTDVVECLRVLAEDKNQSIALQTGVSLHAMVDRYTLRLALINLLANAIRFTPNNGHIALSVEPHATDEIIIEIRDNGPGIDKIHHAHLFERFYRVDSSRAQASGGTGLGLAIARWAVEANKGQISVDSELGKGSCFRIILPRL